jgi:K+-transporting ATPase ATPase A chain
MTIDYWLGSVVTVGLLIYLTTPCCIPSGSERRAMTINGWSQIIVYCAIVLALVRPLGWYMTRVFNGERIFLSPVLRPVELGLYRLAGIEEKREQDWLTYTVAMLLFHVGGFVILYALLRLQQALPFNPWDMAAVPPDLSFNTTISFLTNTNWQNYGGESTLSYLSQMLGLTHQNFLSAATGIVLAVALVRGFARASAQTIGNFWVDATRCTLYILLPICIIYTLFLVWQAMPQTLGPYVEATTLEGGKQTIALGPVASQVAIKMLGTNGGGFFNANAAHPFENPTALSNLVQTLSIFALGAALTNMFGRMVGDQRQGWAILAAMGVLFVAGVAVAYWAESAGTTGLNALGLTGGNMEGKEVRFGIVGSALFAVITTAASCGAVNAMHDSFTPLGGLIPLFNIQLGEIIVGGVGAGLYGMLLFVVVAIFVAGLMVGRTPEYVGKKIEAREVKMAMLAILCLPLMILGWTAVAVVIPSAVASMANPGPHGFSEVLYAYSSQTGNNGSAFAGLTGNTPFYNLTGGVAMFVGRFFVIIPAMAIAGSLAAKRSVPASSGTFPTTGGLFVGLLVGVILIIGGLTFFPALALGPVVEQLAMQTNMLF